ncbi:MAG: hypothetical protein AAGI03_02810 [Pseudomonadota bacterium]
MSRQDHIRDFSITPVSTSVMLAILLALTFLSVVSCSKKAEVHQTLIGYDQAEDTFVKIEFGPARYDLPVSAVALSSDGNFASIPIRSFGYNPTWILGTTSLPVTNESLVVRKWPSSGRSTYHIVNYTTFETLHTIDARYVHHNKTTGSTLFEDDGEYFCWTGTDLISIINKNSSNPILSCSRDNENLKYTALDTEKHEILLVQHDDDIRTVLTRLYLGDFDQRLSFLDVQILPDHVVVLGRYSDEMSHFTQRISVFDRGGGLKMTASNEKRCEFIVYTNSNLVLRCGGIINSYEIDLDDLELASFDCSSRDVRCWPFWSREKQQFYVARWSHSTFSVQSLGESLEGLIN